MEITLEKMRDARKNLKEIINPTPLQYSRTFGEMAGCTVYLKPECLQKCASFKIRGAYILLTSLTDEQRKRGVVTCSAGNWAQGVAYGSQLLGLKSLIVMPTTAAQSKISATKGYGAEVLLHGTTSTELFQKARELSVERNMTYLNAFDEPAMIVGHASIGLEIFEEQPEIDVIVVPVGGGALSSGIAMAAKWLKPSARVFGVQPEGSAAMYQSLKAGKVVEISQVTTMAEGLAVKRSGEKTLEILKEYAEALVLVSEEEIVKSVLLLLERAKLLVEPSGAVPLAALLSKKIPGLKSSTKVALVLSGGNIGLSALKGLLPD